MNILYNKIFIIDILINYYSSNELDNRITSIKISDHNNNHNDFLLILVPKILGLYSYVGYPNSLVIEDYDYCILDIIYKIISNGDNNVYSI